MKRRDFLKLVGACFVCPSLPKADPKAIKVPWVHYYANHHYTKGEIIKAMRKAHKNTKFKPPLTKSKIANVVLFRGTPLRFYPEFKC